MNITHLVENLNRGGLERVVIDLVREQQAQGHHCEVVCLFEEGALAPELATTGVPVIACGKGSGFDLRALLRVRRRLRESRAEVLHTHNAMAHYYGMLAALGLPLACRINTRHNMKGLRQGSRRDWLYRRSLALTDVVASVCEAAHKDLVDLELLPASKTISVPNGIPVSKFLPASDDAHRALARELGVAPETRIVGTVGRMHPAKDHATLIRAFRRVLQTVPESVLVLVGNGELRAATEKLAVEEGVALRVHFLGDRNDVRELLRGFDLFAMSSRTEGYSVALVEACAVGIPIVATNVGGNAEIVRDGINGVIVPALDPDALSAAIVRVLGDRARGKAMGDAGRSWALTEGSVEAMAKRYEAIYRAVCAVGPEAGSRPAPG